MRAARAASWSRFLVVLLLLGLSAGVASAAPALELVQVGGARPFEAEYITEVMYDRVGLLWIGTREGLYLHDGQRFRKFQYELGNPASLASNAVRTLFEDRLGRLWVGTMTGGLSLVDRARWTFKHFRHDSSDVTSLPHDGVFALADADDDQLWVGTSAGLALLDPSTGRAMRVPLVPGGGEEFVMALRHDRAGALWVGTLKGGLFRLDPGTHAFEHVSPDEGGPDARDVFSLAPDLGGGMWVGTRAGLYRIVPGEQVLRRARLTPSDVVDKLRTVTELEPDGRGTLWVGSFGSGLFRVDTVTGVVSEERLPSAGPGYEQRIDEGSLAVGASGDLFIGTFGMGLFHAPLRSDVFQTLRARGGDRTSGLTNEDVWAVTPEDEGHLLVGSFGGGVDRVDVRTGQAEPLRVPVPEGADARGVLSLLRTREGMLWAGFTQGSYRFEPGTGRLKMYRSRLDTGAGDNPRYVTALLEDSRGRVWLGSGGDGLQRYRPETDDFQAFRHGADAPRSLSDDYVTALMEDRRGRFWVGTRSGGLNVCTAGEDTLDCTRLGASSVPRLSHFYVSTLMEDPTGAVWVGTVGGGLQRVSLDEAGVPVDVALWTSAEGLIDDNVMALARAPDGALWVSTRAGLSRLEVHTQAFENYAASDGLPTGVFNPEAVALLGGRLYWGSSKGLVDLDPTVRPPREPPPPLVLTSIEGLERDALPDKPVWELSRLDVPWHQPFSLEFSLLDYGRSGTEYAYRFTSDEPWLPLGTRNQISFHSLPPGEHSLQLRARSPGREWVRMRPFVLRVAPPLWQRTDVRFGTLAVVLILLVAGLAWRTRLLGRRNQALRTLQVEREQALEEAQTGRDRLRRLTMRLEAAKEEERKHLARELHDEFGQALTAVKLNLGLVSATVPITGPAAVRLPDAVALIDRLIGQVRALSVDLRPPQLDELGLVSALEWYLRGVTQRSGVELVFTSAAAPPSLGAGRDIVVFRVIQEAVTNALRHAKARRIDVRLESVGQLIRLEVRDDGKGFEVDQVLTGRAPGSFGVFGMQERVRDLGGRFEVTSRPGEGTRVVAEVRLEDDSIGGTHARVADG
ncbi:two-component regulator propeller domain-containing protein [Myxococcus sp. CA040A]|uniref:sensor histidine kinase n=1 Tax=Myxococcus sp. CA040A TaxID=2741738 RepID=UPI001C2CD1E8|nr:two-component regulator propeller domain-containing protein [Myxococcus sp. CA040A]